MSFQNPGPQKNFLVLEKGLKNFVKQNENNVKSVEGKFQKGIDQSTETLQMSGSQEEKNSEIQRHTVKQNVPNMLQYWNYNTRKIKLLKQGPEQKIQEFIQQNEHHREKFKTWQPGLEETPELKEQNLQAMVHNRERKIKVGEKACKGTRTKGAECHTSN